MWWRRRCCSIAMLGVDLPDIVRQQWPYQPRFARVNGWRMHYVDEGSGDPVVLLHGNPTWGFLYRDFVAPLTAAGYRVIIPDMIGFGLSEKPAREQTHSLDGHIANLTALLRTLDLQRVTLVCHDWGGPTGLGFALANLARMRALVLMSTWAWPLPPAEFHTRIFPWRMMHAPLLGPYLLGRHNALAGRGVYLSVVDRKRFLERAQIAYEAVLPDTASRLLTWTWPRWIPLDASARAFERFAWLERELCCLRSAGFAGLGPRGRRVRPGDLRSALPATAAACRGTASGDRSALPAGRLRARDCRAYRRFPATADMTTDPGAFARRQAAGLRAGVEDRLGHYPEFRDFLRSHLRSRSRRPRATGLRAGAVRKRLCTDLHRPQRRSVSLPAWRSTPSFRRSSRSTRRRSIATCGRSCAGWSTVSAVNGPPTRWRQPGVCSAYRRAWTQRVRAPSIDLLRQRKQP